MATVRSIAELKADLNRNGLSVAELARRHKLDAHLIYRILNTGVVPRRGKSHNVAVALGLKEGAAQ